MVVVSNPGGKKEDKRGREACKGAESRGASETEGKRV
jgi:hypothetical protein